MKKVLSKIVVGLIILVTFISRESFKTYANIKEYNVPQGKSLFLKDVDSPKIFWESLSPDVATVSNRTVYANAEGQAIVVAKVDGQDLMNCKINVTKPEGIKFTYTYPNNPCVGENIEIIAITNTNVEDVRFQLNINGEINKVPVTIKEIDEDTFVWKATIMATTQGKFPFKTEFLHNGEWISEDSGTNNIFVDDNVSKTLQRVNEKRVSDKCIDFIMSWEGFVPEIHKDILAKNTYDIGYGHVIYPNEQFYNNITKKEARALLCKILNNGNCSRSLNNFFINNGIKFNQNQFDSLVSFTYNLGARWTINSDLKDSILDCKNPKPIMRAKVIYPSGINVRVCPNLNSEVLRVLENGSEVILQSVQKYNNNWYQIKTESEEGFCFDEGLELYSFGQTIGGELSNIDRDRFSKCMLVYHHAGGKCIWGLIYRRIDELEMFLFDDYVRDGKINKYGFSMQCTKSK